MKEPKSLLNPAALMELLYLAKSAPPGDFAEVGVYKGGSAVWLGLVARDRGCQLHLFDTFSGIPDRGPFDHNHPVGDFADTSLRDVSRLIPDATYHVGVFPHTMPNDMNPLAFVHVDCDQYSGTRAAIQLLVPLLVPGGIMVFDDYQNTTGATKAVLEAFGEGVALTEYGKAKFVK